jgi:hypothetical protein
VSLTAIEMYLDDREFLVAWALEDGVFDVAAAHDTVHRSLSLHWSLEAAWQIPERQVTRSSLA